jgi:hypothetical protein
VSAQLQFTGLTYDEVREWAIELELFTPSMLAHEMGVDLETGRRSVNALIRDGICTNTGDQVDGPHGYEYVIAYVPPPPGPTSRPHSPDPVQQAIAQHGRITVRRGVPVRIRTERRNRRGMSTPGQRQKMKNNEREYQKQKEAIEKRIEERKSKAQKDPKWKRNK